MIGQVLCHGGLLKLIIESHVEGNILRRGSASQEIKSPQKLKKLSLDGKAYGVLQPTEPKDRRPGKKKFTDSTIDYGGNTLHLLIPAIRT